MLGYIYIYIYTYDFIPIHHNIRHANPTMNTQLLHSNVMDEHQPYWNPGNLNDFQQKSKLINAKEKRPLRRKLQMGLSENRVYLKGHYIILSIVYKYYIDIAN